MQRAKNILINVAIGLNVLLLWLLLFESRLIIPAWLQVAGRLHPLLLHFPVVLIVAFALYAIAKVLVIKNATQYDHLILLSASVLAAFTAICGIILSLEDAEAGDTLTQHKWSGAALSFLLFVWSVFYPSFKKNNIITVATSAAALVLVTLAGHWGATVTHGENYLTGPLQQNDIQPIVRLEDALVFQHMVRPVLQEKCMSCHNKSKAKGDLMMHTEALLLKGGKSGLLWDLNTKGYGLMMDRLHMPLNDKKHMPPTGKPQLTEDEMTIITQWLANGASFTQKVSDLKEDDALYALAVQRFSTPENATYAFEAADAALIQKLNTPNRIIYPLAVNSPALAVEFYGGSQYNDAQLKELDVLKQQIVSLNLNKMPLTDEGLKQVAQFKELRKLYVGFTDITDAGLPPLKNLEHLQQLTVSGTAVSRAGMQLLGQMPALTTIYAWETKVPENERPSFTNKQIVWGYSGDTVMIKLNSPIIQNKEQVLVSAVPLQLKHYVPGVTLRYTLDGSDPDSLKSPIYSDTVMLREQLLLKVKAYKNGWLSSDIGEMFFYKNKFAADSIYALQPADQAYQGNGAATLIDLVKSENNFRNKKWLGYKNNDLDVMLQFKETKIVSSVVLSAIVDIGSYIMPPTRVEVWGGSNPKQMKLLNAITPEQPKGDAPASYLKAYELNFVAAPVQYIRVVARPVRVLPQWHRGRGDKGWVFADEIFVN